MSRLDKLNAMLTADPADAFVLYGIAQEHAKAGTDSARAEAVRFYDRCIAADPAYTYAYYHKAVCQIDSGLTDDAQVTIRQGLAAAAAARDTKAQNELTTLLDQIT